MNNKSRSFPSIYNLNISSSESNHGDSDRSQEFGNEVKPALSDLISRHTFRYDTRRPISHNAELYGSDFLDSTQDHVTVVFNWNYGGNEVYLVEYNEDENKNTRVIKMIKSTNCFTTIQELPKKLFKYRYLVDNVYQYSPDDACVSTADGVINYIDITNFKSTDYTIPRQNEQFTTGKYGNEMPGFNYSSIEPPGFPEILNYRSPDFDNPDRVYSEIHILSNHIYEDKSTESFLGGKYKSYMSLYRWANELTNIPSSTNLYRLLNLLLCQLYPAYRTFLFLYKNNNYAVTTSHPPTNSGNTTTDTTPHTARESTESAGTDPVKNDRRLGERELCREAVSKESYLKCVYTAHHLLYWAMYLTNSYFESLLPFLKLLPLYKEAKLVFFFWLGSDHFKGAGYLYHTYLQKLLLNLSDYLTNFFNTRLDNATRENLKQFVNTYRYQT
ncbi:uncharacterized protein TA21180 [Theileria annulata]|uniref:AMP-activated protein kinase glycogen-binding domain-containing protein n=1 Tax=Theileria annulata TaxID=5874 RepID=Q4UGS1_THEAN|nr:uncharacterized protein TA21180 [Theileria annulata]CAI73718.1 hypothetical protein TA21180 [Theileria annulata]|eukprot:XP_954395.1 hypothetical protein TA21180 [Theileria annulata]